MYINKKSSVNLKTVFKRKTNELPVDDGFIFDDLRPIDDDDGFYGDGLLDEGNNNITDFLHKYGTDTTNNFQLLNWAKQLKIKNFHVLMKDEIKEIKPTKKPLNIITNNNTSKQDGSHWSAFHINNKGEKFWFDSYGCPPLEEIVQTFKSPILGNTSKFQEFNTSYCGQLALYFLYKINNGKSMEEICLELF